MFYIKNSLAGSTNMFCMFCFQNSPHSSLSYQFVHISVDFYLDSKVKVRGQLMYFLVFESHLHSLNAVNSFSNFAGTYICNVVGTCTG